MDNLLLFYLTNNDRFFVFEKFIQELQQIQKLKNVFLLIINSNDDSSNYNNYLSKTSINYKCVSVNCPKSDYLPKVRYAIEYSKINNYKYIMKCDNDIIIPKYTFDYLLDNLNLLDNNLTLSPILSTGIPSIEYFIDSFCSTDEAILVRNEFKKCVFYDQPGIFDYSYLNNLINEWDYNLFFKSLKNMSDKLVTIDNNGRTTCGHNKFYMGMHPIRHGFGNDIINDLIIKNKDTFFKNKECSIIDRVFPYLCDMCFLISTYNYNKLINIDNLIIDGCDEVPLNRYSWNNNIKHLIINNGYAIHITYNWRWFLNNKDGGSNIDKPTEDILTYEERFINMLYS